MSKNKNSQQNKKEGSGVLGAIEKVGNALPHPAMLFVILSIIVIIASAIVAKVGEPVTYYDANAGEDVTIEAVSLLNAEGLKYIFNSATANFTGFAPLGTVLVAMLGVGVAEWTGLIDVSLRKLLTGANPKLLTAVVVFAGIMSNIASDAGYVVVIPLGAIVFAGAGRHPIAGLAAAFAGVSAGFSANLLMGTLDPLLAGITNEALISSNMGNLQIEPTANLYFMMVSTVVLTFLGVFVTERIVEKNLGEYTGDYVPTQEPITEKENRGLRNAGIALLIFALIMVYLMIPKINGLPGSGMFRSPDEDGKMVLKEFLGSGLLLAILLMFLLPGYAFGKTTGKIENSNDLVESMTSAMESMGGYLVLAFFAAQFVNYFSHSNLGTILSVKGAEFLEGIGFKGLPLVIGFILVSAFLNLFIGSASAKWAIMAPIFVPMMATLGLTPALTQVAYRIGDSTTNIITPLMSYFAMIVVFAQRYDEDSGLGTLISTMLPYTIIFLIGWTVLMVIWYYANLPLGPGAFIHLP